MRNTFLLLSVLFVLLQQGCSGVISTEEIDADMMRVDEQIVVVKGEIEKFSGGLLPNLMQMRLEILENTKAMLEQKKTGLNRFINIKYMINGQPFKRPVDYEIKAKELEDELGRLGADIKQMRIESAQYSGGLIKVMIEMKIATNENTKAMFEQKRLSLIYDFPIYFSPKIGSVAEDKPKRKSMGGADLDNL